MSDNTVVTENTVTNIVEITSAGPAGPPGAAGGSLTIQDQGVDEGLLTDKLNFAGSAVSVVNNTVAGVATVTVNAALPGANTNITSLGGITGGISTPDFIQFDTAAAATGAVGKLLWNDTDGTLDLGLKGGNVTLQVGQEQVLRVTNQSGSTMVDGQVVYITGSTGNHLNVTLAQANTEATSSKTIAVITETIANNSSGFATTSGLVRNLNTSALTEGAAIWLSATTPGGLTSTRPTAPDNAVLIGWCVRQHASIGVIYVHIANGYEVDELHDVKITGTPAAGSLLIRNATGALWENATLTAGTGVSITNADKSITITNSAPDQVVSLTAGTNVTITGSYPNFTIAATGGGGSGTVTSVAASGGTTGLTFSGSPITTSGTLTLGGTLAMANGGTGATTASAARTALGATTVGANVFTLTNPSAVTFLRINADNTVSTLDADTFRSAIGAGTGSGTVTSVAASGGTTGLTFSGSPITSSGTLTLSGTLAVANGGTGLGTAPSNGQVLIGNGTNYTLSALTQGTGITITNGAGSITVTNSAPMTYPGSGIAVSTGSAWGTSLTAPSGTIVGTSDAQTLTNKRIDPRDTSATSASSLTPDISAADMYSYTALAAALTINAPTGTPTNGDKLMFRLKDNGTSQTLTWNAAFRAVGVTIPTATTAGKVTYVGTIYNAAESVWDVIAVTTQA